MCLWLLAVEGLSLSDVSAYCRKRLRTSLTTSLCDLKAIPPSSAVTHQYILRLFVVGLQPWWSRHKIICVWVHACYSWRLVTTQEPFPHMVIFGPSHLYMWAEPLCKEWASAGHVNSPLTPKTVHLHVPLSCCYCDTKQTGDLHSSSGQWGQREKGCHGNGPPRGCRNCLIIQDQHHCTSAGESTGTTEAIELLD